MNKFSDTLEKYLDLRDELKNEEDNFGSIQQRIDARMELYSLKDELDIILDNEIRRL